MKNCRAKKRKQEKMVKAKDLLPPDPRPSRAHPEERARRKQLEKEHGYEWVPPVVLGLLGLTLAYDVTRDVEKYEKMKDDGKEERAQQDRRGGGGGGGDGDDEARRRRRRERRREELRSRSHRGGRRGGASDFGSWGSSWEGGKEEEAGGSDCNRREREREREKERDGGLNREDRLEKGEGGPWDRDRERERDRRRGSVVDPDEYYYDDERPRRRRDDDSHDYERGRRAVEERRGRPRMRRHSSDW